MNKFLVFLLLGASAIAQAQQTDSTAKPIHDSYKPHAIIATVSLGAMNPYRMNYSMPAAFEKNNTTGFPPVYAKVEYGVWNHVSLAATFGYDAVIYNFFQLYKGFDNTTIKRYKTDDLRIFGGGVTAFYHLGQFIHVRRLDPFVGVGIVLNNLRYNAYPQGDSQLVKNEHIAAPCLKVGARYYLSPLVSLYADAGFDQQSIFSVGLSCRFLGRKKAPGENELKKK